MLSTASSPLGDLDPAACSLVGVVDVVAARDPSRLMGLGNGSIENTPFSCRFVVVVVVDESVLSPFSLTLSVVEWVEREGSAVFLRGLGPGENALLRGSVMLLTGFALSLSSACCEWWWWWCCACESSGSSSRVLIEFSLLFLWVFVEVGVPFSFDEETSCPMLCR